MSSCCMLSLTLVAVAEGVKLLNYGLQLTQRFAKYTNLRLNKQFFNLFFFFPFRSVLFVASFSLLQQTEAHRMKALNWN